jgi:uncharacterized protein YodC (DUF2158 family)
VADQFKVGTKLRKKSGGTVMTVVKVANGRCLCEFNRKRGFVIRWFIPTAVEALWFSESELVEVAQSD